MSIIDKTPKNQSGDPVQSSKLGKKAREPERFALIGVWAVLIIFFALVIPDTFPTLANLSNMLGSQAVLLILALGLIIPLRAGDYDLSIGSVLAPSSASKTPLTPFKMSVAERLSLFAPGCLSVCLTVL